MPDGQRIHFYGNLEHPSASVKHMGDNRTGEGEGDDEELEVVLADVPSNVERIAFTVTIYEAEARRQNFGQVSNAYIRIVDKDTNQELIRYDLGEDFSIETAIVVGELYKHNGEWKFNATAVDSRAVWQHSADITESKLHKFFCSKNNVTH